MTKVTLILHTLKKGEEAPPFGEWEMPWGKIGEVIFRITEEGGRPSGLFESALAKTTKEELARMMIQIWAKHDAHTNRS